MYRPLIAMTAVSILTLTGAAYAQAPAPSSGLVRPAKAAERLAAINSIQAQLKAFGRDDYKTAITYQSEGLKKNFSSPLAFRAMIIQTYPEFAHSKRAVFGPAQANTSGAHLAIPIALTGADGVTVHAVYLMVREGKVYRVEGVAGGTLTPPSDDDGTPSKDV
ncbi:MAG: DUF4864 domain-containing protein [Janthinobacterium lividum]